MGRLFGTDGVRGVANTILTPELAFGLGQAAGIYFKQQKEGRPQLIIGKDTRISGDMLEAALAAGLNSMGADVVRLGVLPTPGVAYLCRALQVDAGVMISASHNPVADNGIKFFDSRGYKLTDESEDAIEAILKGPVQTLERPVGTGVGRITDNPEAQNIYGDYLVSTVDQSFKGLKVVVDCGYGAAFRLAPRIWRQLGAEVVALNDRADGARINVGCGSTHPEQLQQAVLEHRADLGVAHDGDADRVIAVDEAGQVVDGDQILTICGLALLREGKLQNRKIAATVYSNLGLLEAFRNHGAEVTVTANGDRYVLAAMQEQGLILGGEQSGHIIFLEKNSTGDGILTALQLVAVMARTREKLSVLATQMRRYPQVLENVRVANKEQWECNPAIQAAIRAGERRLEGRGRLLVRASGTEPLIRVMAEGPELKELEMLVAAVAGTIRQAIGS
ncbi:MAG TPA: phosphoglucosamine mutase [Bacillota bacterium]